VGTWWGNDSPHPPAIEPFVADFLLGFPQSAGFPQARILAEMAKGAWRCPGNCYTLICPAGARVRDDELDRALLGSKWGQLRTPDNIQPSIARSRLCPLCRRIGPALDAGFFISVRKFSNVPPGAERPGRYLGPKLFDNWRSWQEREAFRSGFGRNNCNAFSPQVLLERANCGKANYPHGTFVRAISRRRRAG